MGLNPCEQPQNTYLIKSLFYLNKTLVYFQGVIFALLGLFLPLAIGWYSHNENFLSSLSKSEIQFVASYFNMPVDKFTYIYNNSVIAITAIFILLTWKFTIWLEKKSRNNVFSLIIFQLSACIALINLLIKVLKYLFSYK